MQILHPRLTFGALAALFLAAACGTESPAPRPPATDRPTPSKPGQTSFTSEDQNGPGNFGGPGRTGGPATDSAGGAGGKSGNAAPPSPMAPGGRVGEVQEGDIYKIAGSRLYYLNTYKGFIVYDIADPKKPVRVSRLPVFGYPIEMFVEGNTIYALLSDSLYLTETNGKLEFARHNVSQLVTIDISDAANPKVLKTLDIVGQLREGVSRKIDNTIYVVSYWSRGYWWGWGYEQNDPNRQDQAWVYSFNVADRSNPTKTGELKVFEGGAVNFYDKNTGASFNRNFENVYIAATANALMVVENWWINASGGYRMGMGCGYYNSDEQAVVSIIDISDPNGVIRLHTRFETAGSLTDQFKQTYVSDPVTRKGTYYGIFARRGWASSGCMGEQIVQNTIESWDVSNGASPARVGRLDFGKPNETVRGTAFDTDRQVAYAITARQIDPLYAISIADPANLKVLSAIDGLSGDISVFRLVGADKKFLLAVGRDNSTTCAGVDSSMGMANIAVSIIDAHDLMNIRLVQRQCVQIKNADWIGSEVNWNLDQAHKMLGMHQDGDLNVITVPVSYYTHNENKTDGWWWDRYQTAVGIMSWDLTRYDPTKPATQQTVIQNHGTFVHPDGEVRRSVLFTHPALKQRMMANLSDTHISLANIQDLTAPKLESIVEVAPYLNELFRFGDYIVEEVQPRTDNNWFWERSAVDFRVKKAGGELDGAPVVATFQVGQVRSVVKHGNQLVVFRSVPGGVAGVRGGFAPPSKPVSEAVVYDLSNPLKPVLAGRANVPEEAFPYYYFYCGGYWDGFWWGGGWYGGTQWTDTAAGLVFARQVWDAQGMNAHWKLLFLDLRKITAPRVTDREIDLGKDSYLTSLTVDPVDDRGFYLGHRTLVSQTARQNGPTSYKWKDYATRWDLSGDSWTPGERENIPGRLIRTWRSADNQRMLLTSDFTYEWKEDPINKQSIVETWSRLSLLREISLDGKVAAELLDQKTFNDLSLASLVADGDRLFVNGQRSYGFFWGGPAVGGGDVGPGGGAAPPSTMPKPDLSDRLMAFDLSQKKLDLVYDNSTKMFNVQLMGVHQGKLFVNLAGDGILIVDVADAAKPFGVQFSRTLGYATHIEFAGDDVYVGSGFFGTTHIDLRGAPTIDVN
ncbi:MAG TPA: beta-propeller domain-containing protein [Polyangia bacterium]|nr:beta-propeller domain-containing protein [Polyangia bacterium]